jgi:hypothetical protein
MSDLQKLFTKVTGLTFSVDKIPAEKLAWYIPDGAMLDNNDSEKLKITSEFMESAGIDMSEKVNSIVESTINNDDPKIKPEGEGWNKVIDVEAIAEVIEKWILNGTEYDSDPTYEVSTSYDYVYDETSWNASESNGVLKKYHEKYPSEDLWNTSTNSAPGFNDKIYTVELYTDAECTGDFVVKQYKAQWYSDNGVQKIIDVEDNTIEYYIPTFFDTPTQIFELFAGAEGGYVATPENLVYPCDKWIKVTDVSFGGEGVGPAYAGWIANGAQTPWIAINFVDDANVKPIFKYTGKNDIYPWGDKVFGTSEGHKAWGIASLPQEFGEGTYDVANLQIILEHQGVEHIEAAEAQEAVLYTNEEVDAHNAEIEGAKKAGDIKPNYIEVEPEIVPSGEGTVDPGNNENQEEQGE